VRPTAQGTGSAQAVEGSAPPVFSESAIERTLAELHDQIAELAASVQRVADAQAIQSRTEFEVRESVRDVETELRRVAEGVELLEHDTRDALNRHKNVLLALGGRMKRLETAGGRPESPEPGAPAPQIGDPLPAAAPPPPPPVPGPPADMPSDFQPVVFPTD
jgi:TolA-binding protein